MKQVRIIYYDYYKGQNDVLALEFRDSEDQDWETKYTYPCVRKAGGGKFSPRAYVNISILERLEGAISAGYELQI